MLQRHRLPSSIPFLASFQSQPNLSPTDSPRIPTSRSVVHQNLKLDYTLMHARLCCMLGGTTKHLLLKNPMPYASRLTCLLYIAAQHMSEDSAYVLANCKAYPVAISWRRNADTRLRPSSQHATLSNVCFLQHLFNAETLLLCGLWRWAAWMHGHQLCVLANQDNIVYYATQL